ncbi:MAG: ABC transporter permease [Oscillospiraceae bacterium]
MKSKKLLNLLSGAGLPLLFGVALFLLWQTQVLHTWLGTDTITLPLPSRIGEIISSNSDSIGEQVKITVLVALGGLAAGSLLGYIIAVIATVFSKWGAGGLTIVSAFNAIPIVALAPVINNWTRDISNEVSVRSTVAKIIVVTITCTASMSVNAFRGLTELKPFSEDLMKSYAASKLTVFLKLRLPNSLPYVFTALRVSVPASVIGALVTEYFAEDTVGVGRQIRENIVKGQYPTAWAYIAVACAIGIIMYIILMLIERLTLKRRRA